jgi:hypothetical protein
MQNGSETMIMQLHAPHWLPKCHCVRPSAMALLVLGLTSWLGCDGVVGPGGVGPVTSWTVMTAPALHIFDAWGSSSTDVFAVGEDGFVFH